MLKSFRSMKPRRGIRALVSALPVLALTCSGTLAQSTEVGQSVRVQNVVTASLNSRRLAPKDPVYASESVSAEINSHGEIRLNDNSRIVVGENSVVRLDDFVVGGRGFQQGTIEVAKGAFRFITGNSPKGAFTVKTPVSTIGMRGTVFDVYVNDFGLTRVVLFKGEIEACSSSNCVTVTRPCDIAEVTSGEAHQLPYLRSGNRASEDNDYSLTSRQNRFQFGWRAPVLTCAVRAALDPAVQNSRAPAPGEGGGGNFGNSEPDPEPDPEPQGDLGTTDPGCGGSTSGC